MKRAIIAMTWFCVIASCACAESLPPAPAVERSPRAGLPNALADPMAKQFAARLQRLFRDDHAGDVISFRFKGRYAAIYDVIGPESGQVLVSIDDAKPTRPRRQASATKSPRDEKHELFHRQSRSKVAAD